MAVDTSVALAMARSDNQPVVTMAVALSIALAQQAADSNCTTTRNFSVKDTTINQQ